ncbi:MAG: CoA transferase, partial [Rhodospirillaceae bacterium]
LLEAGRSGRGQVVDAAMVDGSALLLAMIYSLKGNGLWDERRGHNLIDGGAPFYGTYQCACGGWIALGAIEPQFYALFRETCGLHEPVFDQTMDRAQWPAQRAALAAVFAGRSRAEWSALLEGTDACFTPVLSLAEAPEHPHNRARGTFVHRDGMAQPAPAPRFSRTPAELREDADLPETARLLADWGLNRDDIAVLTHHR